MSTRPRRARPCAICQTERVMTDKICTKCRTEFGDQLDQPWAVFALQESDATARLIRRKNSRETSLEASYIVQ
jgi:hypothetical protein